MIKMNELSPHWRNSYPHRCAGRRTPTARRDGKSRTAIASAAALPAFPGPAAHRSSCRASSRSLCCQRRSHRILLFRRTAAEKETVTTIVTGYR